jgi:hypothetical protein
MKNFKYNCLFIFIILFLIYFIYSYSVYNVEEFTPYLNQIYRPHFRNIRIFSEGFYVKHKNNIMNLFRKFGIM